MKYNVLFVYVFLMVSSVAWASEDLAPDASITEIKNFCLSNPGEDYRGKTKSEIWTAISRKRDGDGYADLKCANFEGATLEHSYGALKNVDLRGANFEGTILEHLAIENVDLRGANFDNSRLYDIEFGTSYRDADDVTILSGASFKHARITGCDFRGVVAEGADFSYATITSNRFHSSKLPGAQFVEVEFLSTNKSNTFVGADLRDSNFSLSSFDLYSVTYMSFAHAKLEGANFNGTNWADWKEVEVTFIRMLNGGERKELWERRAEIREREGVGVMKMGGVIKVGGTWYEIARGRWTELRITSESDPGGIQLRQ